MFLFSIVKILTVGRTVELWWHIKWQAIRRTSTSYFASTTDEYKCDIELKAVKVIKIIDDGRVYTPIFTEEENFGYFKNQNNSS